MVAFSIEENDIFCSVEGWQFGQKSWRVEHDARRGLDDLSVVGVPPMGLGDFGHGSQLQGDARVDQRARRDIGFRVPVRLAKEMVGFRYDEVPTESDPSRFEVLFAGESKSSNSSPANRAWWRVW